MMIELPILRSHEDFTSWRAAPERWRPVVEAIARAEGLPMGPLSPFATGTNLVVDLGSRLVLKLFPSFHRGQHTSERATLRLLDGRLSVPTPRLVADGEREGWPYLVMTRLDGVVGSEVWDDLPEADKVRVLFEVGRAIAEVQAVPPGELAALEPGWPTFIATQVAGCRARHAGQGLAPHLLAALDELLAQVPVMVSLDAPAVILTGEWIPENLLLAERDGRWRLAGLFDFGDVMTGWREYDLLGPSAFMCAGMPGRVGSLLRGYGVDAEAVDPAMRRRLLLLMLLHRASDLRHVRIEGWEARVQQLADLEDVIWPVGRAS